MAYAIPEENYDLLEAVRELAQKEIKEQCKEYDVTGDFPQEIYDKVFEMGVHTLEIPEEYDGMGLDKVTVAALLEQISIADAGIGTSLAASGLAYKAILKAGNDEQKQRCSELFMETGFAAFAHTEPGAGSDAGAIRTTAVKDGDEYVLNGRKCFITNAGVAGFYLLTAMTDKSLGSKGMSAFIIEQGTPGLSIGNHENKMGIRCSTTADVVLEDCRIPAANIVGKEGDGFKIAMMTLDMGRPFMGCVAVGIAQRAIDEAIAYMKDRQQFGKPIGKNQGLQFKLADMQIYCETARQMVAHAVSMHETDKKHTMMDAIAKSYAGDAAMFCASEAIQIFGGYGYSREYPVEKLLRDAKIFQIFEGTNEIQRIVIANNLLGKF